MDLTHFRSKNGLLETSISRKIDKWKRRTIDSKDKKQKRKF